MTHQDWLAMLGYFIFVAFVGSMGVLSALKLRAIDREAEEARRKAAEKS